MFVTKLMCCTMAVSVDDVRRVAQLARLRFSEDEERELADDLTRLLEYMDKLQEVDTSGVPPMTQVLEQTNALRPDEPEQRISQDDALRNAPETEDGCVRVPNVIE